MQKDIQAPDPPVLIVMLTYNDLTVHNAFEVFEQCKATKAQYFGFKEEDLPLGEMQRLFSYIKACGKNTVLEVVAYDEAKSIEGAEMAVKCGVDILMGTMYFESVNRLCRDNGIKYMPFVGDIEGRPSVLRGSAEGMLSQAAHCRAEGVFGIDLLGYRYTGDAFALNKKFVSECGLPVCIAGSINSYEHLDELIEIRPWAFTIGSAFFDKQFGQDIAEQIDRVCGYLEDKCALNSGRKEEAYV